MARTDGYSILSIVVHWLAAIVVVALFFTHEGERGSTAYLFHVSGGQSRDCSCCACVAAVRAGATPVRRKQRRVNPRRGSCYWGIALLRSRSWWFPVPPPGPSGETGRVRFRHPVTDGSEPRRTRVRGTGSRRRQPLFIPLVALHVLGAIRHAASIGAAPASHGSRPSMRPVTTAIAGRTGGGKSPRRRQTRQSGGQRRGTTAGE